jgi:hypothetical protein
LVVVQVKGSTTEQRTLQTEDAWFLWGLYSVNHRLGMVVATGCCRLAISIVQVKDILADKNNQAG